MHLLDIFRVYRDISSLHGYFKLFFHCKNELKSRATCHFPYRNLAYTSRSLRVHAHIIMDVRKVEMYEIQIVAKCGQFGQ